MNVLVMKTTINAQNILKYVAFILLGVSVLSLALNYLVADAGILFGYYLNSKGASVSAGAVAGTVSLGTSYIMGLAFGGVVGGGVAL